MCSIDPGPQVGIILSVNKLTFGGILKKSIDYLIRVRFIKRKLILTRKRIKFNRKYIMDKAVALLSVFGLGMCFSLLGSISIKLMPRIKMDQSKFGSLISAFMFTCLVASLIMGVIIDSVGYKPVAVFGGHACARAPRELAACDHLFEAAEPVAAWEQRHVLAVVPDRPSGSLFRVLGRADATRVSLDGLFVGEIGVGEWLELTDVAAHGLLESTAPVGVVQFVPGLESPGATNGDPAIANVLPVIR